MRRILLVDDEPMVLLGLSDVLARRGRRFTSELAVGSQEAIELLQSGTSFDALICDLSMPGMDGEALLGYAYERHPEMIRVVLTGVGDSDRTQRARSLCHLFLEKPYPTTRLGELLEDLLDRPSAAPPYQESATGTEGT